MPLNQCDLLIVNSWPFSMLGPKGYSHFNDVNFFRIFMVDGGMYAIKRD